MDMLSLVTSCICFNKLKSRSVKDFNVNVENKNQILTLSTCADNNNYRVVLHAVKC